MQKHKARRLVQDLIIVLASIIIAIVLAQSPFIDTLIERTKGHAVLASLIAGLFFTSAFTTAPAIAVLAKLSLAHDPILVSIAGGFGALVGDLIIFAFIKTHLREDVQYLLSKAKSHRIRHILEHRFARWSLAFLGAIIIASPLPDEMGLAMMGMSNIRTSRFIPISLSFNILGILLIAYIAHSI